MLVNITQTFDYAGRRWFAGENPDVDAQIARVWIAEGKATADADNSQAGPNGLTASQVAAVQAIGLNGVLLFGDSISNNNGGPNLGNGANQYDKGYWTWANAQMGGKLSIVRNAGITGDNTSQMLARLEADVAPYAGLAQFVSFNGGVNDPTGGTGTAQTLAQTKANLLAIINRLRQLFRVVLWHTPTPYALNATVAAQVAAIADFVRQTAPGLPGVYLIDAYAATVNKTATTGDMVTGYSNDSPQLHPNSVGARAIAAEIVTVMTPFVSMSPSPLPVSHHNSVATAGATYATQALPNPLFVTQTGGTVTGTNTTGTAPSDWTVRAGTGGNYSSGTTAVALSYGARSDGCGSDLTLTVTAGASVGVPVIELLTASHHADVQPGQRIQAVISLGMSGASGVQKIVPYLSVTDSNGATTQTLLQNDGATFDNTAFSNYVFKSHPLTLGSSITNLRLRIDITGVNKDMAAVFKLGRAAINILPA